MLRDYYQLTKPGIIYGNALSAIGGFLLASKGHINWELFAATIVGTALLIGSACVFNNYRDRDIDAHMARTKKRALVNARIPDTYALLYGSILGTIGVAILALGTNSLVLGIGLVGFVSYVWWYTDLKRKTVHSTLVGSIPGATPIAAGYLAVTGQFDLGVLLLFTIMMAWQLPHFYAISMFRRNEYAAAHVPVMAVVHGMKTTTKYIFLSAMIYAVAVSLLSVFKYTGLTFCVVMALASLYWLWMGFKGFGKTVDSVRWARKMFGTSLLVLLGFCFMLSIDAWLP